MIVANKEKYREVLSEKIKTIRRKRSITNKIKEGLLPYEFYPGDVQEILNNPDQLLETLEQRKLILLGQQVFLVTQDESIYPNDYFNNNQMKKAQSWTGKEEYEPDIELPLELDDVIYLGKGRFYTYLSGDLSKKLMDARLLNYNFDVQREPEIIFVNGVRVEKPKVYKENVKEIKELIKKDDLEPTQIVINAVRGTADGGEDEIEYNEIDRKLTINRGTTLDIIDGFHRLLGMQLAMEENEVGKSFKFTLIITNYTVAKSKQYQAQFAKHTKISESRQKSLAMESYADRVVSDLKDESDIKGLIGEGKYLDTKVGEIVKYEVLVDAIERNFVLESKFDTRPVTKYLIDFFDNLLGGFREEFITESKLSRKETVMNYSVMFYGYMKLAANMYENKIDPYEVIETLMTVDFSKNNPVWVELKLLNEDKTRTKKGNTEDLIKRIELFFDNIKI